MEGCICRGDEVEKIRAFKDALGLSFEDAAPAHIDVGRRFHRLSNESSKGQKDLYRKVLLLLCVALDSMG